MARQRETVVPTSWSKLTLLQHLDEVTMPTLWTQIDRLSSPSNWPSCCRNFLADTDGANENCNTSKTHAVSFFHTEENGAAAYQTKHKIYLFTDI